MKHIRQRNAIDCGLAVAAMLTGRTYEDARSADPFPHKPIGLSLSDMATVLKMIGRDTYKITRPKSVPLSVAVLPEKCAVIIRQDGRRYGHWICVCNGLVYDPEHDAPIALRHYDRATWNVIRVVTT